MLQHPSPRKWHGLPGLISCPYIVASIQPPQHTVQVPHWRRCPAVAGDAETCTSGVVAPQHFLYFLPLPQGQGSFLPTGMRDSSGRAASRSASIPLELVAYRFEHAANLTVDAGLRKGHARLGGHLCDDRHVVLGPCHALRAPLVQWAVG